MAANYGGDHRRCRAGIRWREIMAGQRGGAARARRVKAWVACAASLLRCIDSMLVHGTGWDPAIASAMSCPAEVA